MSYHRVGKYTGLAGFGSVIDKIGSGITTIGGAIVGIAGQPFVDQGRAEALQEAAAAQQAAAPAESGIGQYMPILLMAGVGITAVYLLTRKKSA